MNILLTGTTGILGKEIKKIFPDCIAPTHEQLDIQNKDEVFDFIKENKIDAIIHTAAITSIRRCEDDKKLAWRINIEGTRNLVNALEQIDGGYFVYVSTACVFRGDEEMYSEDSIPHPINFYGFTKVVGESIVQSFSNFLVIRTNFTGKKEWPYEKAFTDRFGTYLFANDVAIGIKEMFESQKNGIIHLTGDKVMSMYELAKINTPNVKPMTMKDYSGPHLTKCMSLNTSKWKKYKISN